MLHHDATGHSEIMLLQERWLDPECEYALLPASKGNNGSIKDADQPQVNGFAASSHQSTKVHTFLGHSVVT
jgi:hypothetical protein